MTLPEQMVALELGNTAELWDDGSSSTGSSSSSSSSDDEKGGEKINNNDIHEGGGEEDEEDAASVITTSRPNLLCVQLYIETNDYTLQVNDKMGVSMYVNRDMKADEILFQSPIGPSQPALLLEATTTCTTTESLSLTPVRQAFADRFLAWQAKYKTQRSGEKSTLVGASQCASPLFDLADFMSTPPLHKTTTTTTTVHEKEHRHTLSTPENPSYTIELRENDFLIVEFIASSAVISQTTTTTTTATLLPPERRFEILPYDESICWEGEDKYNPALCQRPPTLCEQDSRSLELPGHFSNHACGSSATVYDTYRLATTTIDAADDDTPSSSYCCPLVAPAQSEEVQHMLETYVRTHAFPASFPRNVMTTHRALPKGEEILTDYVLWHWCNEDYVPQSPAFRVPPGYLEDFDWEELTTRFQRAALVLGNTQELWDNADDDDDANPVYHKNWKDLSSKEQGAAKILGYNRKIWNDGDDDDDNDDTDDDDDDDNDDTDDDDDDDNDDDEDWVKLPETKRNAAAFLGYTKTLWDTDQEPPICAQLWHNLAPEMKKAARTIGCTQQTWDAEEDDVLMPWFDCLCGDAHCHSAAGFRGVKYFPLEEQKRLYWICSQWMQNQIDWKIYQLEQEEKK